MPQLYLDDPYTEATSARFTRLTLNSYSANAVSVKVTESHQAIDPETWAWTITPFRNYEGATVKLYSGTECIATGTTNSRGNVSFDGLSLQSGVTYTVKVISTVSSSSTYLVNTTTTKTFSL